MLLQKRELGWNTVILIVSIVSVRRRFLEDLEIQARAHDLEGPLVQLITLLHTDEHPISQPLLLIRMNFKRTL